MTMQTVTKQQNTGIDAAGWIGLAASPTCAVMAWIATIEPSRFAVCAAGSAMLPMGGMAWMYLLMSFFHLSPWLKLAFDRPRRTTQQ